MIVSDPHAGCRLQAVEATMLIGERLRSIREEKKLSQGEIEKRSGLLRCYISRVENGHTVPSVETLEKWSRALELPLHELFYEAGMSADVPDLPISAIARKKAWGSSGKDAQLLAQFRSVLRRTDEADRKFLLSVARKMARIA